MLGVAYSLDVVVDEPCMQRRPLEQDVSHRSDRSLIFILESCLDILSSDDIITMPRLKRNMETETQSDDLISSVTHRLSY